MPDSDAELTAQNAALTRQLLEWIAEAPRTYREALDTWRSSCPRHTIWEDALLAGLIECPPGQRNLALTARGFAILERRVADSPGAVLSRAAHDLSGN